MTAAHSRGEPDGDADTVTITREDDWFVARHEPSGIASQGKTRPEALGMLAEALAMHAEDVDSDVKAVEPDAPWF